MGDFNRGGKKRFGRRDSDRPRFEGVRRERSDSSDRREKRDFHERREFDGPSRGSEERMTHKAICDKCGDICELPFKPRGGKPVYCSKCFRGVEYSERSISKASSGELEQINAKLDKILKALKIN